VGDQLNLVRKEPSMRILLTSAAAMIGLPVAQPAFAQSQNKAPVTSEGRFRMRHLLKGSLAALTMMGSLAIAAPAWAGCADGAALKPTAWSGEQGALFRPISLGNQGIVGLWDVTFKAPNGATVDWGYSEWHSDGTEIMNSGGHTPASGNFCLGVWRQSGPNTYHLKHFPLAYNPVTQQLAAKIILTEDVTVDHDADSFSGPFTLDAYDPTGATLLQHVTGTVTGRRVKAQ